MSPGPPSAALLIDMDGVLFHGDRVLPGAAAFLAAIADRPHCFVTNNPIRSPQAIIEHFANLGLPEPRAGQIVTSAEATAQWLADQIPDFRFFAIGAPALEKLLSEYGRADSCAADVVVIGEGPGLDYETMTTAINLVMQRGARLVCTNPDHNVDAMVDGRHRVLPGGGALVAPIAVAAGVQPTFIGKPNPLLYEMAMTRLGVMASDCVMVGDRPDTDIAGAQALKMRTALVRTGRFAPGEPLPNNIRPDEDFADLRALMNAWFGSVAT